MRGRGWAGGDEGGRVLGRVPGGGCGVCIE